MNFASDFNPTATWNPFIPSPSSLFLSLKHSAIYQQQNEHLTALHMMKRLQGPELGFFERQTAPIPYLSESDSLQAMLSKTQFLD
jgi:hypothetical protein